MRCAGHLRQNNLPQEWTFETIRGGAAQCRGNPGSHSDNAQYASSMYEALREYNSDGMNNNNLSNVMGAAPIQISDVVHRLNGRCD